MCSAENVGAVVIRVCQCDELAEKLVHLRLHVSAVARRKRIGRSLDREFAEPLYDGFHALHRRIGDVHEIEPVLDVAVILGLFGQLGL